MGGTSGQFVFPDALGMDNPTAIYRHWICDDMESMITAAKSTSPYEDETMPDPDDHFGSASAGQTQYELDRFRTAVEAQDADTDYQTYAGVAITEADTIDSFSNTSVATGVSSVHSAERTSVSSAMTAALSAAASAVAGTPISAVVDAYQDRIQGQYLRAISRMAASMADINAVNGSAFAFGMASISNQFIQDVNLFDANLTQATYQEYVQLYLNVFTSTFRTHLASKLSVSRSRDAMIDSGLRTMTASAANIITGRQQYVGMQLESNRMRYVADREEFLGQLDIDAKDTLWDFNLYKFGGNLLATAGGATALPEKMTPGESTLAGMGTGAAIGHMIAPGVGTAIGAGVGAIVGWASGI